MDRTETPTAELLLGIAKALKAEAEELEGRDRQVLHLLIASTLDCYEWLSGGDS